MRFPPPCTDKKKGTDVIIRSVGLLVYWLSDICGRSILLAIGLPNMAWSILLLTFLFKLPEGSRARTALISTFTVVFQVFYAATAGTSPFSISAEVFPLVSREVGMAVSVAVNLLGAGLLVLVFPVLLEGPHRADLFSVDICRVEHGGLRAGVAILSGDEEADAGGVAVYL